MKVIGTITLCLVALFTFQVPSSKKVLLGSGKIIIDHSTVFPFKEPMDVFLQQGEKNIKVFVTTPHLVSLHSEGLGEIEGEGLLNCQNMDLCIKGSGDVYLSIEGENLSVSIQGPGDLIFNGDVCPQDVHFDSKTLEL